MRDSVSSPSSLLLGLSCLTLLFVLAMYSSFFQLGLEVQPRIHLDVPIIPASNNIKRSDSIYEDAAPSGAKKGYHFVFNSDCSRPTGWHYVSFIAFYSFLTMYPDPDAGHTLTELYSCSKKEYLQPPWHTPGVLPPHCKLALVKPFNDLNSSMAQHGYLPYNKPLGLAQLLAGDWAALPDTDIVVVIDPDFYFLKPLSPLFLHIKPDVMINGYYAVGSWPFRGDKNGPLRNTLRKLCPRCETLPQAEYESYAIGVPNIMHLSALRKIVPVWTEFTYAFFVAGKGWQEEQYAYIAAAAHLNFHSVARDDLFQSEGEIGNGDFFFIHYCQQYHLSDKWMFWKHEMTMWSKENGTRVYDPKAKFIFTCDKKVVVPVPTVEHQLIGTVYAGYFYTYLSRVVNGANLFWQQLFCNGTIVV